MVDLGRRALGLGDERGGALLGFDQMGRTALLGLGEDLGAALLGLGRDATGLFVGRAQDRGTLGTEGARASVASSKVGFAARRWASLS